ncbi:MAG: hypothetical protein B7Z37_10575 [Verrucomicrobia bacterium 12-59-8]|nr:MAG: hypothetical protein B7Z37_10575 [Verrucomicrobia bacterium 12-59-8]
MEIASTDIIVTLENVIWLQDEQNCRKSCLNTVVISPLSAMNAMCRLLLILPAIFVVSCSMPGMFASSTPHKIKLKDGREVPCEGAPQYQEKTGYYRYRTPDKRDAVIRADDVVTIVEQRA